MIKTKYVLSCLWLAMMCCVATGKAQETKSVRLDAENPFQDKIQLAFDDKGLELDVTIAFEESANRLTLTMMGNRKFIAFSQDTYYKNVFRHPFLSKRQLHAEKLQYKVLVEPNSKYYLRKSVYKSYRKKRHRHLINACIEPDPASLTFVVPTATDSFHILPELNRRVLTQEFDVNPKASEVLLRIRNIMVVDVLKETRKKREYEIVLDYDLDLSYRVAIVRNPCYGQEETLNAMQAKLADIQKAYRKLFQICPSGKASTIEEVNVFKQHQEFLLSKYQVIESSSLCSDVNGVCDTYNHFVDSIGSLKCIIPVELTEEGSMLYGTGISPDVLINAARQLDKLVAQIMVTNDEMERRDIYFSGRNIISVVKQEIEEKGMFNEEQRRAYGIFDAATQYFSNQVSEFDKK